MTRNLTPTSATDSKKPGVVTYPRKVIQHMVEKGASGCMTFHDPQDSSVRWNLYVRRGQLTYATSASRKTERLQCLIRSIQPELSQLEFPDQDSEYQMLCQWWHRAGLPMARLRQLLMRLTLEAWVQTLALPKVLVEFNKLSKIEPILIETPLTQIQSPLWQMALQWQQWRQNLPSPFSRLYLEPDKHPAFRTLWQQYPYQVKGEQQGERFAVRLMQLLGKRLSVYQIAYLLRISAQNLVAWLQPYVAAGVLIVLDPESVLAASDSSHPHKTLNLPAIETQKRQRIACIDDSKTIQKQVKGILEMSGFEVLGITEPAQALSSLVRQKPAAILMDVNMPDIDGYELCSMLRQSRQLREIPIIMLTGRDGILDRIRAKTLGVNYYLTKPFNPDHLIESVQKVLQNPHSPVS
jgi:twitching motility two-component system response regulator PilG